MSLSQRYGPQPVWASLRPVEGPHPVMEQHPSLLPLCPHLQSSLMLHEAHLPCTELAEP